MDKRTQIIKEWRESTDDTIAALLEWRAFLVEWERHGEESITGDFDLAFSRLREAGLDRWADGNPCGGGLDVLKAVVCGEDLPEPPDLLTAIFGEVAGNEETV